MISICDYDAGNIRSVQRACAHLGYEYKLTRDRNEILSSDHVILPGVGSMKSFMKPAAEASRSSGSVWDCSFSMKRAKSPLM